MNCLLESHSESQKSIIYLTFAFIRIALTFLPQTGYIHPDEFFQSIEVVAGDVFDVESNKPWEFNCTFPVRSILIPSITIGLPYRFLRLIQPVILEFFDIDLKTPYWLIVLPRLSMCLLSFIIDYCLYKICRINREKYQTKLIVFSTSYVSLIYATHTFSNSIEMVLISILLYLVADSQTFSHAVIKQNEFLTHKYKHASAVVDRVRLFKMKCSLPCHTMRHCIYISFIAVLGFFNRPTFLAFAFPAVFFWLHRGLGFKSVRFADFHYRMLIFIVCTLIFTCIFIIIDSIYFGYLSMAEVQQLDISINNFVVTPFNFIKYNMDTSKLAEHGLHPRFMHIIINIPLLYNVLGVIGISAIGFMAYRLICGKFGNLPRVHSIKGLMVASIISPVAVLSYFPHQEPRFLIPITLPMIYLYSDEVASRLSLIRAWWCINVVCVLFYGFIHQAGLYPMTSYLSTQIKVQHQQHVHLVTSHVYSLPISLLMLRNSRHVYGTGSYKYRLPKALILYEMGSSDMSTVLKRLTIIQHIQSLQNKNSSSLYVVLPKTKSYEFLDNHFNFDLVETFYPHVSTEALPNIINFNHPCFSNDHSSSYCIFTFIDYMRNIFKSFGLGLYKVHL